jgi:hypothetical protein
MQQITVFIDLQDQLNICPKHVELILKINKHLFVASSWSWFYYIANIEDARSNTNQMTLSCRVTWVWSDRVNLYNQQIMKLLTKAKSFATSSDSPTSSHWQWAPMFCQAHDSLHTELLWGEKN